ncbi:unnamed protein product, partial [marine sediment metagenome]
EIRESNLMKKIKILPSVTDLINGNVTLSDIHEIELEDLLGRSPVKIDFKAIKDFIQDKKVLITGAGGSIGSELAKSILQFNRIYTRRERIIFFNSRKHNQSGLLLNC